MACFAKSSMPPGMMPRNSTAAAANGERDAGAEVDDGRACSPAGCSSSSAGEYIARMMRR